MGKGKEKTKNTDLTQQAGEKMMAILQAGLDVSDVLAASNQTGISVGDLVDLRPQPNENDNKQMMMYAGLAVAGLGALYLMSQ